MKPILHLRTSVSPEGRFIYGIHKPSYNVANLRLQDRLEPLGELKDGTTYINDKNFPKRDIKVTDADWIFEIPNPFSFRGSTFIDKEWADASATNTGRISLPSEEPCSMTSLLNDQVGSADLLQQLPKPLLYALATNSTDPEDLTALARLSCEFVFSEEGEPVGLQYLEEAQRGIRAFIHDHDLFEAVANNPHLPDIYKITMVIRPGAQGGSEIIGEVQGDRTHVFEYLRRNSYIANGHYAANMADDAIRYSIDELSEDDVLALRHLYYQRSYQRLIELNGEKQVPRNTLLTKEQLEELRLKAQQICDKGRSRPATLWGWNFGFDFSSSGYRLHASHQQIHQQYAMVPETVEMYSGSLHTSLGKMQCYSSGDLLTEIMEQYTSQHNRDFFEDYLLALRNNKRMDERDDLPRSLIVWEDERVLLFVPKAQTSQWELQLMTKKEKSGVLPGNILETDPSYRRSLDIGILTAQKALASRGARMVTSIEYSKRIGGKGSYQQPLVYSFLPKLPQSPGGFSEAHLRFINGHYPEDFAKVCRQGLKEANPNFS